MFVSEDFVWPMKKSPTWIFNLPLVKGLLQSITWLKCNFIQINNHIWPQGKCFNLSIPLLRLWRYALKQFSWPTNKQISSYPPSRIVVNCCQSSSVKWMEPLFYNRRPSNLAPPSFGPNMCFFWNILPSRELTYPPKMAWWRWFSFSQAGIC